MALEAAPAPKECAGLRLNPGRRSRPGEGPARLPPPPLIPAMKDQPMTWALSAVAAGHPPPHPGSFPPLRHCRARSRKLRGARAGGPGPVCVRELPGPSRPWDGRGARLGMGKWETPVGGLGAGPRGRAQRASWSGHKAQTGHTYQVSAGRFLGLLKTGIWRRVLGGIWAGILRGGGIWDRI